VNSWPIPVPGTLSLTLPSPIGVNGLYHPKAGGGLVRDKRAKTWMERADGLALVAGWRRLPNLPNGQSYTFQIDHCTYTLSVPGRRKDVDSCKLTLDWLADQLGVNDGEFDDVWLRRFYVDDASKARLELAVLVTVRGADDGLLEAAPVGTAQTREAVA